MVLWCTSKQFLSRIVMKKKTCRFCPSGFLQVGSGSNSAMSSDSNLAFVIHRCMDKHCIRLAVVCNATRQLKDSLDALQEGDSGMMSQEIVIQRRSRPKADQPLSSLGQPPLPSPVDPLIPARNSPHPPRTIPHGKSGDDPLLERVPVAAVSPSPMLDALL